MWKDNRIWLTISLLFLILAIIVPPQQDSILANIAPSLVESQVYKWTIVGIFIITSLHFGWKVAKKRYK